MHKLLLGASITLITLTVVGKAAHAVTLQRGISANVIYIQDYFSDVHGGRQVGGGAPGILDLSATLNGRSWDGTKNNRFHFDLLGTFGSSISNQVGDIQGLDNIGAYNTFKVFSAWYQHTFGATGVSLRLGMQDYTALFDTTNASLVFINSSFGLGGAIAQTFVSTFPTTTLGGVVRWKASNGFYAMAGIYNGIPGEPGHPEGTHLYFGPGDGVFSAAEIGLSGGPKQLYKIGIGGWYQTTRYHDFTGRERDRNHGEYVIGQARLYSGTPTPDVDGFVQIGEAQSDANMLNRYIGTGVSVTGLVPGRGDDSFGLGMARVHTSDAYQRVTLSAGYAETVLEMTYQAQLNSHVMVQPDLQYIMDPGASRTIGNALVAGLRGQFSW